MSIDNEFLTYDDLVWLDTHQVSVEPVLLDKALRVDSKAVTVNPLLVPSLLTKARLSEETSRREQLRLAAKERAQLALRSRKRTKARGRYHWKSKLRTKKKAQAKSWATDPFGCLLRRRGYKNLKKDLWDSYIAHIWEVYPPTELKVEWSYKVGLKGFPVTIYDLMVVHIPTGKLLFDGNSQLIFDASAGVLTS